MIINVPILLKVSEYLTENPTILDIEFNVSYDLPDEYVPEYTNNVKAIGSFFIHQEPNGLKGHILVYDIQKMEDNKHELLLDMKFINKLKKFHRKEKLNHIMKVK